jgi:glycosyltransferase involved in cell wall biosynthesis
MKILFVITKSDLGGAQVFVLNLARALQKFGCEVEVAAGDGDFLFKELEKNNIEFHYLKSLKRDFSLFNALYFVSELHGLLKVKDYDVLHLNSSNTLIGSLARYFLPRKPKTVFTFHGLSFIDQNFSPNVFIKALAKFYFLIFLRTIDKSVFECKMNYDELKNTGMIKEAEIIYNGIDENDLKFLSREEARKKFEDISGAELGESFLIGSTGRLAHQKNYEFLINNFLRIQKEIPNVKVVIIGDGPDRINYETMIKGLGLESDIILLGELVNSHQYMKGFDLFTLTSRYEGVSISLIEALYASIPVLVSNVGGNQEVVGNSNRQLFNLDDIEGYINNLLEIRINKNYFINHNIKMKENFALDKMAENYKKLFDSLD